MRRNIFQLLIHTLLLLSIVSCGTDKSKKATDKIAKDDFSSPLNLYVDYISSYTDGVISRTSSIRLRLTKPAGDSLAGQEIKETIFKFSPSVRGSTFWEDNRTVVFTPSEFLPANQSYEVTTNLKKLLSNIKDNRNEFKFTFQTLVQNFDVKITGPQLYDVSNLKRIKIEGTLLTADFAKLESIQSIISAKQDNKELSVTWQQTGQENKFKFIVEEVERKDKEDEIVLKLDGNSIGVSRKENLKVTIPALDDYKVMSSTIIRGTDNYISVIFSDPLLEKQDLTGFVVLEGVSHQPRLVVNLNELKIYPTQEISSKTKLTIYKNIKNRAGYELKENYETELQFTQIKPEVKLVDNSGKAILPNSEGLILPFEAVGLSAVDVTIIRIFEDNVLQYLQVNGLGGSSQLRRVGRPVAIHKVPLNTIGVTNLSTWNRFTLNLEDIFKTEPGAIYQIKISFKKAYSLYFCPTDNVEIEDIEEELEEWGAEDEDSYWDDYEYYYNSDYNWEERDNPCSNSYYASHRTVSKILFASDFGIIAKKRDGGDLNVFVSNLLTAGPLSDVSIEVYDYQQQLLASGKTSREGKVIIPVKGNPFVLVARKNKQYGYLKLDDGSSLSLSNFDVTGAKIQYGLKGFIYGERGVWRPGDTIYLGFILEDMHDLLPDEHPVVMELWNSLGQLNTRKISTQPVGDIYRFDLLTGADDITGNWLAKAKVGGATFTKTIKIETIKPNRLKIELDFGKEKLSYKDQYLNGDLNVRWLTGATASNLKAEFELLLSPIKTKFKEYPNYSFDDESKQFYSERELVFEGRINSEGYARVNINLGKDLRSPGALNAKFLGKVYEEGGDFSIKNISIPFYPYKSFVGLKIPEGDKRGILLTDEDHSIPIVTIDSEGKPVSRQQVKVQLYKLNWKWWWDNSYDNISNYVGRSYRDPVKTEYISTTNGEGKWNLRIDYPAWGRYYLRVEDPISGHSAGNIVRLDWPGWAGKGKRGDLDGASMLDFGVEKEEYQVGEKITLSIPSTEGNQILVSLESGSKVLQTFWVEAKDENTTVDFEATSEMAPNVYAYLTMIQPHAQTKNDLPLRLYGIQSIKVIDPNTQLDPIITMPDELRPEDVYTIKISEANKKAMDYTIAVVDEGLLDITNFKTPDPWSVFYAREALGIKTWDVFDDVIGAYGGQIEKLLAIGGDDELEAKDDKETNRFKPVVNFLGPFHLNPGKLGKHTLKMPQYIGSVKIMVVASSKGSYGKAEKVTPVKQPLMVLATLPRVAGPGEFMKLPVNVFALSDKVKKVSVKIQVDGVLELQGNSEQLISFSSPGDKVLFFDIKAKNLLGVGKVKVVATSGQLTASYDVEMNVIPRNPRIVEVIDNFISPGESWDTEYKPMGISGNNTGTIEFSILPPLNIDQRLGFLIRYPHGCIEQTTSAVFAQLYIENLTEISKDQKNKIQKNIKAGIKGLKTFQLSSGGFSYWPGMDYTDNWGSNYAGHFLIEAQKKGYKISEGMISKWISFQTQKAEAYSAYVGDTRDRNDLIQAYRLYTLALAEKPSLGAMNRMKEMKMLSRQAKWRLALAYAIAGYEEQAINLVKDLSAVTESNKADYVHTYGSPLRDQAMILETLIRLNRKEEAFAIVKDIAEEMSRMSRWMSTQTTAYCFIAISGYVKEFPLGKSLELVVDVDNKKMPISGEHYVSQFAIAVPDKDHSLSIQNKGTTPVFARLIRSGIPIEGKEKGVEKNITLSVVYTTMDGKEIDVSKLKQGTNFRAIVEVSNPGILGDYHEVAVTQIFPSGWEIINTRLEGTDKTTGTEHSDDYTDIRDDRVMNYFDLKANEKRVFKVILNASYQGRYYLPSLSVEAMYDNSKYARKAGKWVEVVSE